jgi:hypothetical protein
MTQFDIAQNIQRILLNKLAETQLYNHYTTETAFTELKDVIARITTNCDYQPIDPTQLTAAEMDALHFGIWEKESPARLIPLWLYPFLAAEFLYTSVMGHKGTKTADMDTDSRFGYLAYMVTPREETTRQIIQIVDGIIADIRPGPPVTEGGIPEGWAEVQDFDVPEDCCSANQYHVDGDLAIVYAVKVQKNS